MWFILEVVSCPGPFSFFNVLPDAVLVRPPYHVFICYLVLPDNLRMHLFVNVWSFLIVVFVTFHVSEPCSNKLFTLVLKIRIFFLVEMDGVFCTVSSPFSSIGYSPSASVFLYVITGICHMSSAKSRSLICLVSFHFALLKSFSHYPVYRHDKK